MYYSREREDAGKVKEDKKIKKKNNINSKQISTMKN